MRIARFEVIAVETGRYISNEIDDVEDARNVLYAKKPFPEAILRAAHEGVDKFEFGGCQYKIVMFEDLSAPDNNEQDVYRWADESILYLVKPKDMRFGARNCPQCGEAGELVTVLVRNLNGGESALRGVLWCGECEQYFCAERPFKAFLKEEEIFMRHEQYANIGQYGIGYAGRSTLSQYGYVADGSIDDRARRRIIDEVIARGIENVQNIVGHLEWLYSERGERMVHAGAIWRSDIGYLYDKYYEWRDTCLVPVRTRWLR